MKQSVTAPSSRITDFSIIASSIGARREKSYLLLQKEGFNPIAERWRELSSTLGKRVKVLYHREYVEGEAVDVDLDGGLLIRNDSGFINKIMAGDVVKVR